MENGKHLQEGATAQRLTDDDLAQASGGVGYSSVQCKKCGKAFTDLDQYRQHLINGCKDRAKL